MWLFRYFLKQLGYTPYALELGVNFESKEERIMRVEDAVAFREKMVELCCERLQEIHNETGEKVSLLGWSMGGLYAFDCGQALPETTRQIITLGSPFGDPRSTSTFKLLRKINRSTVPIEIQDFDSWNNKSRVTADIPTHVIYSNKDGIVAPEIARLDDHPMVKHHEVDSSHVAFAVNPLAMETVARILANEHSE
jgi:pimeloyl-ACP methyl ester carboxylesterase